METMRKQAERFGTEMIAEDADVGGLRSPALRGARRRRELPKSDTVILATGATAKLPRARRRDQAHGRGVSTCATCDGFFFKDRNIMVVGGGDSAMEEALYLARLGRKVEVVHRRDSLRASKFMQDRARENPKIELIWNSAVDDILDVEGGKVTAVRLKNLKTGALDERPSTASSSAIGHRPNTEIVRGQVDLLPNDYVKVRPGDDADVGARCLRRRGRPGSRLPAGGDRRRHRLHGRARGRALLGEPAAALARVSWLAKRKPAAATRRARTWPCRSLSTATSGEDPATKRWSIYRKKGIPFVERNVGRDPGAREELMALGLLSLPVLLIGDKRLTGFNPAAIDAALNALVESEVS